MTLRLLCFATLLFSFTLSGQTLDYRQGELIVRFGADVDAKEWLTSRAEVTSYEALGRALNIYLIRFDHDRYGIGALSRSWWQHPAVQSVQRNYLLAPRRRPNDPRYAEQWQNHNTGQSGGTAGADHNLEAAWDFSTGGVTANGDTIVVAIIDNGVDTDHEDLLPNLWINHDEIPDNNLDDDDNGYIDDYYGFNTFDNSGDVEINPATNHGTAVAGLVGARGDNNLGVAGVNWNVKLMIVRNNFANAESEVIKAYSYALEQKLDYLATDGAEGAYVVATNASWGRSFAFPDESPIWCELYDELGAAGILNVGATSNADTNVDAEGDLPSLCPSDFFIAVTNLNDRNRKVNAAGFGATSIDLGAYGDDVFTTLTGNTYGTFNGTSAAAPAVAGAIGLLYSAACGNFGQLMAADPAVAALRVRQALLNNVADNSRLRGITVTGGALDVGTAMAELIGNGADPSLDEANCKACLAPTSFTARPAFQDATALTLDWRAVADLNSVTLRYRPAGTTTWTELSNLTAPYELTGLSACVSYELQLAGSCTTNLAETSVLTVATDGCCVIPSDFTVTAEPGQFFATSWTPLLAGRFYRVRYRKQGTEAWTTRTSTRGNLNLAGGIEPCTAYEFEFQTDCDTLTLDFGNTMTVVSTGCGACNEADYCQPDNFENGREWIREVDLGGVLVNRTEREEEGYASFGEVAAEAFVRGGVYPLKLRAGTDSENSEIAFRVYLDANQDGFFAASEIAADLRTTGSEPAYANLTIPETAALLLTRMRVVMQFNNVTGGACAIFDTSGEVEDYCLRIVDPEGCPPPTSLQAAYNLVEENTRLRWPASAAAGGSYRVRYRLRGSQDAWTETDVDSTTLLVGNVNLCGAYEVDIASLCGDEIGEFNRFYFSDVCTGTDDRQLPDAAWSVFPNPAAGRTTVNWSDNLRADHLRLLDLTGRELRHWPAGTSTLDLTGLPGGVYLLRLALADGRVGVRRLVISR